MDSELEMSASAGAAQAGAASWRLGAGVKIAAAMQWLGWRTNAGTRRRPQRRMQLDKVRSLAALLATTLVAMVCAFAWTWQQLQHTAQQSAATAIDVLDARLDDVAYEINLVVMLPELRLPLTHCSDTLLAHLLEASLQSRWVRKFEVLEHNNAVRCGPQGQQLTDPALLSKRNGLTLVLGEQIATRPGLQLNLPSGRAVKATLDPRALPLTTDALSTGMPELPDLPDNRLRIVARSSGGGSLVLAGPRSAWRSSPALMTAQTRSSRHDVSVAAEVSKAQYFAAAWRHSAWAALWVLLITGAVVAWVWRRAVVRSRLRHRLEHALRKRQFEPFVQPIVDLRSGRCVGGEVLMRWAHPVRGVLGPAEFIEEAERTGLILGMSDLVMTLAAHRLATLAQADPTLYFSFNVTPGQLREAAFPARLNEIFRPDTLPQQQVILELTERDFMDPHAKRTLIGLRADGWRIAIDDFGTGQSSLATIESLPIDRIKIDRAFVSTIEEQTVNRPVLDAIIALAAELKVGLIAEGIETQAQWDYLAARGVASAQGYLMARPMPISQFLTWLQARATTHTRGNPGLAVPSPQLGDNANLNPLSPALRQLWQDMGAPRGLKIEDRSHKLQSYKNCFIGKEAVNWLVAHLSVSRAQAVHLGRGLVAAGLLRHVLDEHDFEDDEFFYRLAPADPNAATEDRLFEAPLPDKELLFNASDFPWRSNTQGLVRHHRTATGRAVVDWIVLHHQTSRHTASQWASHWMRQGALRHVFDSQGFSDSAALFRLA